MPTIKDVARLAGVGLGTASRALSGRGSVSPKTLERVNKAIEQLGFRPSHAARSLLSGSSQMIGVFVPVSKGTFYTPILQAINASLRAAGLNMLVDFGLESADERRQAVDGMEFLLERGCDGLIVMSNSLSEEDIASMGARKSQVVLMNHSLRIIAGQCFTVDHQKGGALAARALVEMGHRRIAAIAGPSSYPDNAARMSGFLRELGRAGLARDKIPVIESDFSPEGGWKSAEALLGAQPQLTALFCANDEMAVGALSYCQDAKISVPHDVSVIGYDDTSSASFTAPRLTSVRVPWPEVAVNAVNALLNLRYGSDRPVARDFSISVTFRASLAKARSPRRHAESR